MTTTYLKTHTIPTYPYKVMETPSALRAIIFDCDGVLVDSEPLHFAAFKKTLAADGAAMTGELYTEQYLALDDRGAFSKFYLERGRSLSPEEIKDFLDKKAAIFQQLVETEGILPYPAVPEFVMAASQRYPLAIASGARRHELEMILEMAGIRPYFEVIISADDVQKGKPDPESFFKVVEIMNGSGKRPTALKPAECVVIEDSKHGIISAHSAGMKCVAVATSYPAFELSQADLVVPSLASLKMSQVEDLFVPPTPLAMPLPQNN